MPLESATYITGLVSTNPDPADQKRYGDDHLRLIKSVLLTTFPNANAAITALPSEINYLSGASSNLQAQIIAKAPIASPEFTGTPTAPTASSGTNNTQLATTQFVVSSIAVAASVGGVSSVTPGPNLVPLANSVGQIAPSWNSATATYAHANLGGF